jgi:catechol 2,3-dioxygenase-like lactoylglutathione lyase family enzyme
MAIIGIDTVVYGVEDLDTGVRFFTDWGLKKVRGAKGAVVFETRQGTQVVLRPHDDPDLPPAPDPGSSAREVIWGVKSKRDLDAIERELAKDRPVRRDRAGVIHAIDPMGFGVGFRVWRGRRLEAARAPVNAPGRRDRVGKHGSLRARARPARLGHVVFFAPDFAEAETFYTKRLGFVVSDRIRGRAVYLRCAKESDHHNLFYMKTEQPRPTFNHLAFEVEDIHAVIGGGMYINERGWETEIGPGRHKASSAYFWYFKNPCGGAAEYFADSDWCDARWKPQTFAAEPAIFAEWAVPRGIPRFTGGERMATLSGTAGNPESR